MFKGFQQFTLKIVDLVNLPRKTKGPCVIDKIAYGPEGFF